MNSIDFEFLCRRLELNFGQKISSEKSQIWFEKFRAWNQTKFSQAVEKAIEECQHMPNVATLLKFGQELDEISFQTQKAEKEPCGICNETGAITAILDEKGSSYRTTFRCPQCRNWEGRMSDKIPIWTQEFRAKGYKFQLDPFEHFYPEEEISPQTASWLKDACPEIYKKAFGDALKSTSADQNLEMERKAKERVRQRSLEEEKMRDIENYDFNPKLVH